MGETILRATSAPITRCFGQDRYSNTPQRKNTDIGQVTEAALFHRCRKALGRSTGEMARALLIAGDRNIRRWEDGHHPVSGSGLGGARNDALRGNGNAVLAERIATVIEQRRQVRAQA
jgi:hypothetical protein